MKTMVIQEGDRHTIRAIAFPTDDPNWDRCEVLKFFEKCNDEDPDEMEILIALLEETADFGPPQTETRFRHLPGTDALYEFKTRGGLRVFCFWDDEGLIICTHGYEKGGQKAPKQEITRATKLKKAYFVAKNNGTLEHGK
jgi:phage-related protein